MKTIQPQVISVVDGFSIIIGIVTINAVKKYNAILSLVVSQDEDEEILELPIITNITFDDIYTSVLYAYNLGLAFSSLHRDSCIVIDERGNIVETLSLEFVLKHSTSEQIH